MSSGMHVCFRPAMECCKSVCKSVWQMLVGNSVWCVCPTRGSFTVRAYGQLNDKPYHPNHTMSLSSPQGVIVGSVLPSAALVVMVATLSVTGDSTQRCKSLESAMNYNPEALGDEAGWQRLKYGCGFVCCDIWRQQCKPRYTALVALYFSPQKLLFVYAGRMQDRGNYSIMVHGEFSWLGGDQEFITTNLKAGFGKEEENCARVLEEAEMCNRFLCTSQNIVCECSCGHVLDLLILSVQLILGLINITLLFNIISLDEIHCAIGIFWSEKSYTHK